MADIAYDVIIIGGGPGGYVTAIRAAQLGMRTAVVEREHLGGICLNWGCIPTKALLRSAEIYHYAHNAADYGLQLNGTMTFDPAKVVGRSRGVSAQLNGGVGYLLKKNKVDVIWGEAKLTGGGKVDVSAPQKPAVEPAHPVPKGTLGHGTYSAKHIIIATGARPRILPIARDTVSSLRTVLGLARGADLVVTIGGASVGDHDLVAPVAAELGMEQSFYKVAMRPGKPLMAGRLNGRPMVGLPGNPVSAMVCGTVFLAPMLRAMMGLPAVPAPQVRRTLAAPLAANGPRAHYMRAIIDGDGVRDAGLQDSSLLSVLACANALIVRPPHDPARHTGDTVDVIELHNS